jgi:late competence protein required for DNA uptake (superfamily II DNA/RNA helicase)
MRVRRSDLFSKPFTTQDKQGEKEEIQKWFFCNFKNINYWFSRMSMAAISRGIRECSCCKRKQREKSDAALLLFFFCAERNCLLFKRETEIEN